MASIMSIALLLGAIVALMVIAMGFKKMKPKKNNAKGGTVAPIKAERAHFISQN